ncbi:MAG: thiamine pyrophosphate-dependent enzyme [Candidatus Marsarchaeota archaeon]|nr:thiamine pyrophosphate-dependent enzyme [Candidatus Marsarchaeota archaeon]
MTDAQYRSGEKPVWCPGCGDYGVSAAIMKALGELNIPKNDIMVVTGIGCSSAISGQFSTYGIHGIHGRLLPIATGVKLANPKLTVIGAGGDGDGYGIGAAHFIHAARRNIDLTYIVMDNEIYGLTTGQASPTSLIGMKTKSTPFGVTENPINPLSLAISAGATYVARGFSGDPNHLSMLIKNGITHKGFALIDIMSPCVTFNHDNTYDWLRKRIYKLEDQQHDPSDMAKAFEKATEFDRDGSKMPLGLFYKTSKPLYEELDPVIMEGPVVGRSPPTTAEVEAVLKEYM